MSARLNNGCSPLYHTGVLNEAQVLVSAENDKDVRMLGLSHICTLFTCLQYGETDSVELAQAIGHRFVEVLFVNVSYLG